MLVGPGFLHGSQVGTLEILDESQFQSFDRRKGADDDGNVDQAGAASSGQAPVAGDDGAVRGNQQRLEYSALCGMSGNRGGQFVDAGWIELATRIQRVWPQVSQWPACRLERDLAARPGRSKRFRAGVVDV